MALFITAVNANLLSMTTGQITQEPQTRLPKDSGACLEMMFTGGFNEDGSRKYDFLMGDYEPVEPWEYEETDEFFTRLIYPMYQCEEETGKLFSGQYYGYRAALPAIRDFFFKITFVDVIKIIKKHRPNMTKRQIEGLKERPYLIENPAVIDFGKGAMTGEDSIMNPVMYIMLMNLCKSTSCMKNGLSKIGKFVESDDLSREATGIGLAAAKSYILSLFGGG